MSALPGELSTKGGQIALDGVFGRATQTARSMYLALLTAAPNDATTPATMTEYSATGYARQLIEFTAPTSADPPVIVNTNLETFGPLTGATGGVVITHCALVSSASGTTGDLVFYWTFTTSKTPAASDSVTVAVGSLTASAE